ncbi:MAG: family 10 glycosylhydrolase [Planctomycetes bacterium]|nr:family 10 glycosylhydrolase [Planctomycetota bacterium]
MKLRSSSAMLLAPFLAFHGPIAASAAPPAEVRGTWVTTTANDAIATPQNTASTMSRLKDIGINTVYVEVWKNGYTQFPSKVLERVIGVDRRPALMPMDPSDAPDRVKSAGRDLLGETLAQAHKNDLTYIAWFEYGFMAAHKSTDNHLRRMKPDWLSRDIKGNEVAPNGFVWMNPLHPEARRFLLDIVLEAVNNYDLDGIQLDDRIVWPYITMGYDEYTRKIYAQEHAGKQPPDDHTDPEWMRWRADKINEFARHFVEEVHKAKPNLIVSLSPAVYPWCYEHYLLEWPKWAAWEKDPKSPTRWDEFIPQCYRFNYPAFEQTWNEQVRFMNELGNGRVKDLVAGIRVVGEGPNATWDEVRQSIELVRKTGGGGHVLWFSKGVLDAYPTELKAFYDVAGQGPAANPRARAR